MIAATTWEPKARISTAAQVCEILRDAIITHALPPETRLSEIETAQRFGVSRQPVREAFITLAAQGLVDVRAQRGTFVTRISLDAVMDARFVREAVEADIVKLLAADPDPALIADLQDQLTRQADMTGTAAPDFIQADETFHRTLAEGAGKASAWRVVVAMKAQMDRVRVLSSQHFPIDRLIDQHRALVAAIAAGDVAGAEAAIRTHLQGILADLPVIRQDRPDYFT
ncbi:GntR family transcriptional regulator [Paracoccus liaowanqingii]|uniref:GntR family transcriptional regulator n=1 Tax=Paracoccus liaowanqingii TaxID=2560053 RepID=A0A4Z1CQZ9_9RHOB|nr:GntR family transcriptional regulator [Paracoccus liaowanqingii]TGN67500.1 GntR family transcriptional regulator [Paracoccus liaowanqingii]